MGGVVVEAGREDGRRDDGGPRCGHAAGRRCGERLPGRPAEAEIEARNEKDLGEPRPFRACTDCFDLRRRKRPSGPKPFWLAGTFNIRPRRANRKGSAAKIPLVAALPDVLDK